MNTFDQLKDNPLLPAALEQWGLPAQLGMAIEETGELLQAINHMWRGRHASVAMDKMKLCEEIGDVMIVMAQLRLIDTELVDSYVAAKLARLKERLNRNLRNIDPATDTVDLSHLLEAVDQIGTKP